MLGACGLFKESVLGGSEHADSPSWSRPSVLTRRKACRIHAPMTAHNLAFCVCTFSLSSVGRYAEAEWMNPEVLGLRRRGAQFNRSRATQSGTRRCEEARSIRGSTSTLAAAATGNLAESRSRSKQVCPAAAGVHRAGQEVRVACQRPRRGSHWQLPVRSGAGHRGPGRHKLSHGPCAQWTGLRVLVPRRRFSGPRHARPAATLPRRPCTAPGPGSR